MDKFSSKLLNLLALQTLIEDTNGYDGVMLMTPYGTAVGILDVLPKEESTSIACSVAIIKDRFISNRENDNDPIELVGDGSMFSLKNAVIKPLSGQAININEITFHSDSIIAFSPVNIEDVLNQWNQQK